MRTAETAVVAAALALTLAAGSAPALALPSPDANGLLQLQPTAAGSGTGNPKWSSSRWASWQLHWENDAYAAFSGSDEHYTNGVRLNWLRNSNVRDNPEWTESFAEWWCASRLCADGRPDVGYGHALGQNLYTPTDITIEELIPDDRPYAGYLYFSFLLNVRTDSDSDPRKTRPVQNLFELQLGVVGPLAGGEPVQKGVHELIDDDEPVGWDNQLDDEPAVNLLYLWRKRIGNSSFDVVPHWGASLGNVATYVNAGATVRLGRNISDFPHLIVAPTAAAIGREEPARHELYAFVGADGRAVAHNIFLDGNTFSDSHSVDKESFVYDLKAGFTYRYTCWRFTYTFVRRSREFHPVPAGSKTDGVHDFGSLSLSYQIWPPPGQAGTCRGRR